MTLRFSRQRFLVSACLLLTPAWVFGQDKAIEKRWPKFFKPSGKAKIALVSEGSDGKPFIYHTRHFELRSTTSLSRRHLQEFATTAESVPQVLARFPLPLLGMPKGGRAKVLIFPDEDSFVKAGGTAGAAGYYSGRKVAIMLRADTFLMPPPPSGSRLPPKADYDLLVHEFVHLCMHRDLGYLPTWFAEGVAEYIAAAHVNHGTYRFDNIIPAIRDRVKQGIPHETDIITLPGVKESMALTSKTWQERVEHGEAGDSYRMYGTSLLLVHTLFHGGPKRREATNTFLLGIRSKTPLDAKNERLIPSKGRDKLQAQIIKYWRPRGLRLRFTNKPE